MSSNREVKIATKESWKNSPMPDENVTIKMNFVIPSDKMERIKRGIIPEQMEDRWFMYCDDNTIRYFRSWTGHCIFLAKYEQTDKDFRVVELTINRDPEQYTSTNEKDDEMSFLRLLTRNHSGRFS